MFALPIGRDLCYSRPEIGGNIFPSDLQDGVPIVLSPPSPLYTEKIEEERVRGHALGGLVTMMNGSRG